MQTQTAVPRVSKDPYLLTPHLSSHHHWDERHMLLQLAFYVGFGDLNSGLYVCTTGLC